MVLGVGLVVLGSVAHAVWNLLVKRAGTTGVPFVWLYSALVTPVLVAVLLVRSHGSDGLTTRCWQAAVVSAGLHTLYAVVLQRSYALADLAVVYPVARAGAPVLVALVAATLLDATLSPVLLLGIALVASGVPLLVGSGGSAGTDARGLAGGLATAGAIAAYTCWDAYAVTRLGVDVASYLAIGSLAQLAVLTIAVARHPRRVAAVARTHWQQALPVAALVPLSYGLVLLAFRHLDVQVVAAVRSSALLAAAVLGWWLLDEPRSARGGAGALLLTAGVALAALGG